MCGRFTLYADPDFLAEYAELENWEDIDLTQRYNIAPSQPVLTMVQGNNGYRGGFMKWGLIPFWAKDITIGYKMINARSETIGEKRSFQPLVGKRHCLIFANGFYEWKKVNNEKQPYYIQLVKREPMMFAGLWDRWKDKQGKEIISCTVLTTEANNMMKDIHDRMPVIIPEEHWGNWLNPKGLQDTGDLFAELFEPFPSDLMTAFPVSTDVNYPKNDSATCIEEFKNSL